MSMVVVDANAVNPDADVYIAVENITANKKPIQSFSKNIKIKKKKKK